MRNKLQKLNSRFPDIVRIDTAADKLGVEYLVNCGKVDVEDEDEDEESDDSSNECVLDIVTVTDHLTSSENKVQVFISGCTRGDARVGPNVAYYLIEYQASNFNRDP